MFSKALNDTWLLFSTHKCSKFINEGKRMALIVPYCEWNKYFSTILLIQRNTTWIYIVLIVRYSHSNRDKNTNN